MSLVCSPATQPVSLNGILANNIEGAVRACRLARRLVLGRTLLDFLADKGFRVLAPRGHGSSPAQKIAATVSMTINLAAQVNRPPAASGRARVTAPIPNQPALIASHGGR